MPPPYLGSYETTEDVLSTDYEDEAVVVHLESKRCFRLNDTAAAIWRALAERLDRGAILERLHDEYEVDSDTAEEELDRLIDELVDRNLIRPVGPGSDDGGGGGASTE